MVEPANVMPFMGQDVGIFFLGKIRGQVDLGPQQPRTKGEAMWSAK